MKALILIGLALAAGLPILLSTEANADPVLVGAPSNPVGVDGLVVDGTTYNVLWTGPGLGSFTARSTLSIDAAAALAAALNELNANPQLISQDVEVDDSLGFVDAASCDINPNAPTRVCQEWLAGPITVTSLGEHVGALFAFDDFAAKFTPVDTTTVPEPVTLSLFGAGLAGLGAIRRRKKAKA